MKRPSTRRRLSYEVLHNGAMIARFKRPVDALLFLTAMQEKDDDGNYQMRETP